MVLTYAGRVRRWSGFIPYLVIGVVHLAALASGAEWLSTPTKLLLMPALLLALLVGLPRRRTMTALWASLAVLFSWAGDVLLATPGGIGFILGLGLFALAHAAYVALFLGPIREHGIPRLAYLYAPWWLALVFTLAPYAGSLLVPVAIYGLVLGLSAATAMGSNRMVVVGGLLFLLSDTVLAFKLFFPDFSLWQPDVGIMLGYITGQGLIIAGAVLHARRAHSAGSPHNGAMSPHTSPGSTSQEW